MVVAVGRHLGIAALACCDADRQLVCLALVAEGRGGILGGVVAVVAVVLIQFETAALSAREDAHNDVLPCAAEVLELAVVGQDAARLDIDGILVDGKGALERLTTLQQGTRLILKPLASREPHFHANAAIVLADGFHDGRNHHVVAEHILVAEVVGLLLQRVVVIHGTAERDARLVVLAGHRIDIRYKRVAAVDDTLQTALRSMVEGPRFLVQRRVFGGVCAQDGQVLSHLHGTGIELCGNGRAPFQAHVAADVVAPVAIEHVGGRAVEVGQIGQALPRDE